MTKHVTWEAPTKETHGDLTTAKKADLPKSVFAFPEHRKEPMTDASHVRNAIARFDQVKEVSEEDRDLAFRNIKKAAKHFGVEVSEEDWRELGDKPHTKNRSH